MPSANSGHINTPPKTLVDLAHVKVRKELPVQERIRQFVSDVGNPYWFQVQGIAVHVRFQPQARTLQESLLHLAQK